MPSIIRTLISFYSSNYGADDYAIVRGARIEGLDTKNEFRKVKIQRSWHMMNTSLCIMPNYIETLIIHAMVCDCIVPPEDMKL